MIEARMPLLGDRFPEMTVATTFGPHNLPNDYQGKWFVLFSHPGDFTPVCTTEFVSFQKHYDRFRELNTELIGLSVDQVFSHMKWVEWIEDKLQVKIEFPIIADDQGRVSGALGLLHPAKGTNTVRAVFIVDPTSILRAMLYYPQELGRNIEEILRMVRGLHLSDLHKVAMPANWPENDLLGDRVIVPPPTDLKTAEKRKSEYDNYDWWFAHKSL
jgi:peroxiredoxin 2/4